MAVKKRALQPTFLQRWKSAGSREARLAFWLLLPTGLIVFGLVLFPALFSIWISFHKITLGNLNQVFNAPFVGFQNYKYVIDDFAFKYQGLDNMGAAVTTVVYAFTSTTLTLLVGTAAALLLNKPFKGRGLARAIFLFPYVSPVISVAFVWRWILSPLPSGVMNDILMRLNLIDTPAAPLSTRGLALVIIILFEAWRYFPFAMLMILARLQAIDADLYEAAEVDGANKIKQFFYITLPELRYVVGAIFLLRLIWTFNKFDDIFLLTGGGFGTNVLPVLTYQFSFKSFNFGKGAANAMILLAILIIFLVIYISTVMRDTDAN